MSSPGCRCCLDTPADQVAPGSTPLILLQQSSLQSLTALHHPSSSLPHPTPAGVCDPSCRRCSARMKSGKVDQPGGMISEEGQEEGYALLCVAYPQGDCSVQAIPEVRAWQHSHTLDVLLCGTACTLCTACTHACVPGTLEGRDFCKNNSG